MLRPTARALDDDTRPCVRMKLWRRRVDRNGQGLSWLGAEWLWDGSSAWRARHAARWFWDRPSRGSYTRCALSSRVRCNAEGRLTIGSRTLHRAPQAGGRALRPPRLSDDQSTKIAAPQSGGPCGPAALRPPTLRTIGSHSTPRTGTAIRSFRIAVPQRAETTRPAPHPRHPPPPAYPPTNYKQQATQRASASSPRPDLQSPP